MAGVVASKVRKKRFKEVTGEDDQEKGKKLLVSQTIIPAFIFTVVQN